jgi:YesN/AraC family two-component response regulator
VPVRFTNPLEAINYLTTHHQEFLLILTDIRMPEMNGFQLAELIKQMDEEIKIICMSAFDIHDNDLKEIPN